MKLTSGCVKLNKNVENRLGLILSGGAPLCPCIYVVRVLDDKPAAKDGTLASGDEIVCVNGQSCKGRNKVEVARLIQGIRGEVVFNYNKLHADPEQGITLDIIMKKMKHEVIENMNSDIVDNLCLSRAILNNDGLVKKLRELEKTAEMYRGMIEHTKEILKAFFDLSQTHKQFGDVFSAIGVREPQPAASEAFSIFGDAHREIEKHAIIMLKTSKPMIVDLNTFVDKAVPDTRLTIKKYLDTKFEYLAYCLKVTEMEDEEIESYKNETAPLRRVKTGNYEYRLVLLCRQDARTRLERMRNDVLIKMELLDQKHVQDTVFQLRRLVSAISRYNTNCHNVLKEADVFPIPADLSRSTFSYDKSREFEDSEEEEEGEDKVEEVEEEEEE